MPPTALQGQAALAQVGLSLLPHRLLHVYTARFHVPGPRLCPGSGACSLCSGIL